ncbi:lipoprotein-releasing system permease protein [Algoriphagus iocasae]|uniref:Lipoprotein-releasing system permease protein n=1 Tax=Algoriphagus iocasae TaxID=1836499 RepID=A0A841MNG5_9BACT|nr:FtsX-like permease family protein [Algoriphagus iocasae]MBB6326304.1 lipoprotein-releasing system permease protein [Algoriphagus iocasae]
MNLSFFIAGRYFRSKKKRNFITILSTISMVGVAVGTMALVIVMSVFNGLEDLIRGLFASFDAELKIEVAEGKSFEVTEDWLDSIRSIEGVEILTEVIEDNALFDYNGNQMVARLKGVSDNFLDQGRFSRGYFWGDTTLGTELRPAAILGRGVGFYLSINLNDINVPLKVFYPKAPRSAATIDPNQLYSSAILDPAAFFSIDRQFDDEYVIAPLDFAKNLLNYGNRRTSLEIKVEEGKSINSVQARLKELLGRKFLVKNTDEQHAGLLRTVKLEKLFVFLTLTFILAIASFNIFFSLSMLAIEKKKDIAVLKAMGAPDKLIRRIFLKQGSMIAFSGALIGLILGFLICLVQEKFGLVSLGISSAVIDAYPVKMIWTDFVWISMAVVGITLLASYRPAFIASKVDTVKEI